MLKKAGIVVAAAAAGLLAVSPLAFAGEMGDHGHGHGHGHDHGKAAPSHSVTYDRSTTNDHSPSCNGAPQGVLNNQPQSASNSSPLASILGIAANVAAPITTQVQAPILSCNNLENIANVNVSDNFQDNSRSTTNRSFNNNG